MLKTLRNVLAVGALCGGVIAVFACFGVVLGARLAAWIALVGFAVCVGGAAGCHLISAATGRDAADE
jgi:hypothetical protein